MKIHIKKGDKVLVIAGESRGQQGQVMKVNTEKYSAIVEGVNFIKKHTKPNAKKPEGGIVSLEAPVHISNLMLVDPKSGKPIKIGRKKDEKTGKLVRYAKKTGEVIK